MGFQFLFDLSDLFLASDKCGELRRQIIQEEVESFQRREGCWKTRYVELIDMLRVEQIF